MGSICELCSVYVAESGSVRVEPDGPVIPPSAVARCGLLSPLCSDTAEIVHLPISKAHLSAWLLAVDGHARRCVPVPKLLLALEAADVLSDRETILAACTALRAPMLQALGVALPPGCVKATGGLHASVCTGGGQLTPEWAAQILFRLPLDLATTLLRVTIGPQRQPPLAAQPPLLSIPGQFSTLRDDLFPLVLRACAPCIDAHHALAVRAAPDSHAMLVTALPYLTTLTALTVVISRRDVTDVEVSLLMHAVRRLPRLVQLSVTDEESNSQRMVSLALSLAAAPRLQHLSLTIPGQPCGMGLLLDALQQPQPQTLCALELCCNLTDVHAPQLSMMLPGLTALRELTLRQARLSHEQAANLVATAAALPGFTRLTLDHVLRFRDDADILCAAIGCATGLRALQLREAPGGIPLLTGLGGALERHLAACTALTALDVGTSLPRGSLQPLGALLRKLPEVQHLSVRGARRIYNDLAGLRQFASGLQQLQGLTALDLGGCAITVPVAVEVAAALPRLPVLRVLWLDNACMHPLYSSWAEPAAQVAPALAHMTGLQELHLAGCALGQHGAVALAPAVQAMLWLRGLQLQQNGLGSAGMRALTPALAKLTRLQVLNLSRNEITAEGMELLARGFGGLLDLRELVLSDNPLLARGAAAFAAGIATVSPPTAAAPCARAAAAVAEGHQACAPPTTLSSMSSCETTSDDATAPPVEDEEAQHSMMGTGATRGAEQTALTRLERLQVDRCNIGATGLAALSAAVRVMHELRELWCGVEGMRGTDAEAAAAHVAHLVSTNPGLFVA
eukprot:jgi/Ulvmu1/5830/UM025_0088.1